MELIPLIYSILEILTVLTLVTLTVSYISYRKRIKNGYSGLQPTHPILKNETPVTKVQNGRQQQLKDNSIVSQPIKRIKELENPAKRIPSSEKLVKEKMEVQKAKLKKINYFDRLQIIKNLKPIKSENDELREEILGAKKTDESLNSLDEDIISKYEEKEKKEFHTLKVTNKKDNHFDK